MPLDGLRAWIGEVERKLGMRTRVFLVLATIAIGAAGAAIYLAVDTRDNAVSESDVQALQEQLEEQIVSGGTGGTDLTQLEADLNALEAQVEELNGEGGATGQDGAAGSPDEGGAGGRSSGSAGGTGGTVPDSADAGAAGNADTKARLRELLEQTEKQNTEAEADE